MARASVEVFAEIACPFTYVGLRRIVRRRDTSGLNHPVLRVRAWPLERVNGEPMDPAVVAQHVDELREQAEPELFRGFDPASVPATSMPAFAVTAVAAATSDALAERVALALRNALFEEGRDVSDPAVLAAIRADYGLGEPDAAAVASIDRDYDEGRRRGVRGSPEYFLDGRGYFCPVLRLEEVEGRLDIEGPDSFDDFIEACFR